MTTIAITVPNGWAVREYLLSSFLSELAREANVVILSPLANDPSFRAHFASDRVTIEPLHIPPLTATERELERLFVFAQNFRHPSVMGNHSIWFASRKHKRERLKLKSRFRLAVVRPVTVWTARHVARHLSIRQQMQVEQRIFGALRQEARRLRAVLDAHRVDLLFSTMPVIAYFDRAPLWAAEEAVIPTACIVPGWDNLYAKARMPVHFAHYLVWSEWMEGILRAQYPDIGRDAVSIVGPLFLDFCFRPDMRDSRDEFLRSIGGDPHRSLILWACAPKNQTPHQPQMVEDLWAACRRGLISRNPQLLVRPHPVGGGAHFAEFRRRHPEVLFTESNADDPNSGVRWNPSLADQKLLINSVLHADVLVNFSSSITLEAFALDTPVVNVAFDAAAASDYDQTTRSAYGSETYRPVVEHGATKIAYNHEQLVEHVASYLGDPSQQRAERAALLRYICSVVDGSAAARAAAAVLHAATASRGCTPQPTTARLRAEAPSRP